MCNPPPTHLCIVLVRPGLSGSLFCALCGDVLCCAGVPVPGCVPQCCVVLVFWLLAICVGAVPCSLGLFVLSLAAVCWCVRRYFPLRYVVPWCAVLLCSDAVPWCLMLLCSCGLL